MSEKPISPLRQRMIEDMTVRKLGAATQRNYIRAVKTLSEFLDRSPANATPEDLRQFQVHQSEAGAQPPVMNSTVTALRFFFRVTLDRPEMARHLTLVRQPRKLPSVLSRRTWCACSQVRAASSTGPPSAWRTGRACACRRSPT